jgi:BT1 family
MCLIDDNGEINFVTIAAATFHEWNLPVRLSAGCWFLALTDATRVPPYGTLGLIDVTRDLWIKESLSFTPSQLAGIGVWLTLPWTVKMVFGELVDTVPMFGSQRKSYILIGALLMATGLLILAGAAGRWLTFARPDQLYVLGAMLVAIGTVLQDVVADAMSTEVVPRTDTAGNERLDDSVRAELGMVQVLGRLAVSAGVLAVAGLSGWRRRRQKTGAG